ncbi:MAG: CFI-box-CTERM domain-containing protein [Sandaracinaceae bacterium]|nr:CFI-box-CTERM domain-containing protein [Sandaracinaceae bacterium]
MDRFASDAREVMPELDAVTTATPPGDTLQRIRFTVPEDWPNGNYYVYLEINVEGDYSPQWGPAQYPTPRSQGNAIEEQWDYWAMTYGYPYRGQPSIVFRTPIKIGQTEVVEVREAYGRGSLEGRGPEGGRIFPIDSTIANDPQGAPGSGVDRLRIAPGGYRLRVRTQAAEVCQGNRPPSAILGLEVRQYHERRDAHRYAHLRFIAPEDDQGVVAYEVRVSEQAIVDEPSFLAGRPANAASLDNVALVVPTDVPPGQVVEVDFGGLSYERRYWIGVRALDACNASSPIAVAEYVTPPVQFTTVSPCFIATAAYGTPLAKEIDVLRRFRDRYLITNPLGARFVDWYYNEFGPPMAFWVSLSESRRELVRNLITPIVRVLEWMGI